MTPELQVINHLLYWTIFTGFVTGLFFSGRLFDLIENLLRIKRFRDRKKKLAERVSTSDSGN